MADRPPKNDRPVDHVGNVVGKNATIKRTPVLERRIGRFRVAQTMLLEPHTGRAIFREMIVMRAEANFIDDTLMVWADHPSFDILAPGSLVPEYVATITAPKGIPPRRHQDLVVQWKLAGDFKTHDISLVARLGSLVARLGTAEEKTRKAFSSEAIDDATGGQNE